LFTVELAPSVLAAFLKRKGFRLYFIAFNGGDSPLDFEASWNICISHSFLKESNLHISKARTSLFFLLGFNVDGRRIKDLTFEIDDKITINSGFHSKSENQYQNSDKKNSQKSACSCSVASLSVESEELDC